MIVLQIVCVAFIVVVMLDTTYCLMFHDDRGSKR